MSTKSVIRFITLLALFLIPLFPIVVSTSLFFPYITGKAFLFRILVEVAFAGWVILACLDSKYRPRLNGITIGATVFALVAIVADLLGVNPVRSIWSNFERMEGWLVIVHLWMFLVTMAHTFGIGEEGKIWWRRWFKVSLAVATYVAIRGAMQWAGALPIAQSASRPDSTLGNAAYLAVYMLMHVGISAYLFFKDKSLKLQERFTTRWVYIALGVFFSAILFSTATRGTILGLLGGILLALALYAIFGSRGLPDGSSARKSANIWRSISGGIIVLIIFVGSLIWFNRESSFVQNNETLRRMTSISLTQFRGEGRSYIWPMAIKGWSERPILGWGQENFNYIFNANYDPGMWGQEQWFDRAHSVYLDWLVAGGAVGILAYLFLYVWFLVVVWKSDLSVAEKSVLTGLLGGYAIHNVFVFDNLASYAFFYALLGVAASIAGGKMILTQKKDSMNQDTVEYVVAPIVIVLLVAGLYFLNIKPLQANTRLISAMQNCNSQSPSTSVFEGALAINNPLANQEIREQILQCAGTVIYGQTPNQTKQAFFDLAIRATDEQIAYAPNDARMYALSGSFLTSVGRNQPAIEKLEKALELSPRKQSIIYDLATAKLNLGDKEGSIKLLKEAYESATTSPRSKTAYAIALMAADKEAEARSIFGNDPIIFESREIAQAYMALKKYDQGIALYKKFAESNSDDINKRLEVVQAQYTAGKISEAVASLNSIKSDFPEYTERIDQIIKAVQDGSAK